MMSPSDDLSRLPGPSLPSGAISAFLRGAWFVARNDVAHVLRKRETIVWVFVMPVLFFYFIGTVTGGPIGPVAGQKDRLAVRGGEGGGTLVDELLGRLRDQNYDVVRPDSEQTFATFSRRLTIANPADTTFTEAVLAGKQQTVTFEYQGDSLTGNYDQVRVARAVYEVLADLAVVRMQGQDPTAPSFAALKAMPRTLTIASKPAGRRRSPPGGFAQAVPGTMVMFTMLVLFTSGAIALSIERRQGLLRRLASAPIPTGGVVLGKWMGMMLLGLVQIGFGLFLGTVLFKVNWGAAFPMVCLVLVGWSAFTASLAILLASVARTEAQTAGIGVLATQLLAGLGGCWWPIEITPDWMQKLALALPTGWTMAAMHQLINFGSPAAVVIPHLAALLIGAAFLGWLGTRTFKYQ